MRLALDVSPSLPHRPETLRDVGTMPSATHSHRRPLAWCSCAIVNECRSKSSPCAAKVASTCKRHLPHLATN